MKLGDKLLIVSRKEARHVKGKTDLHREYQVCQPMTTALLDNKGSESARALHGPCTQAGVWYQAKPGGLSGKTDLLSPGGL